MKVSIRVPDLRGSYKRVLGCFGGFGFKCLGLNCRRRRESARGFSSRLVFRVLAGLEQLQFCFAHWVYRV